MKKVFGVITGFVLSVALFVTLIISPVSAQGSTQAGVNAAQGTGVPTSLFGDGGVISTITNILLFLVGALAVIMIIIGGIRYATSGGSAAAVTSAKNTVLYAIVGLIIAFLAFAAVNWLLGTITFGSAGYTNV